MTIHVLEPPISPNLTRSLVRFNADQYHHMLERGTLPEDSTTELLNGIIVHKDRSDDRDNPMGHGPRHRLVVRLLTRMVARIDSDTHHLQVQLPIKLSDFNEPEPDGAIIKGPDRQFADHLPTAADVLCVIEVAHSSLERDTLDKLPAYAAAAIPQYIIINLRDNHIEIHTQPDAANAAYQTKAIVKKGQFLRLHLGTDTFLEVPAADLLP